METDRVNLKIILGLHNERNNTEKVPHPPINSKYDNEYDVILYFK